MSQNKTFFISAVFLFLLLFEGQTFAHDSDETKNFEVPNVMKCNVTAYSARVLILTNDVEFKKDAKTGVFSTNAGEPENTGSDYSCSMEADQNLQSTPGVTYNIKDSLKVAGTTGISKDALDRQFLYQRSDCKVSDKDGKSTLESLYKRKSDGVALHLKCVAKSEHEAANISGVMLDHKKFTVMDMEVNPPKGAYSSSVAKYEGLH